MKHDKPQDENNFKLVYEYMFPDDDTPTMAHCAALSAVLAHEVGRTNPWGESYIYNLVCGHQTPGPKLRQAIQRQAGRLDYTHPWLMIAREITMFAVNGVEPGTFCDISTRYCLTCGIGFIPNHWKRTHCRVCRPPRKK